VSALRFAKMEGAGNDFVVLDLTADIAEPDAALARRLADRHFGIGCDQILLIEAASSAAAAFGYRILNADGSIAGQCGNGARCVALYLRERHGLADGAVLDSPAGPVQVRFVDAGRIELSLSKPRFEPADIPFVAAQSAAIYAITVDGRELELSVLSMGNPHAVLLVDDVATAPVASLGPAIEQHARFPDRCNVGFAQILEPGHIRLRVYERGVGETLACGSGACAAVVALRRRGLVAATVAVDLPGGRLEVRWRGPGDPVYLIGPARFVFEGEYPL
jgi:diaminopimelate epimerase